MSEETKLEAEAGEKSFASRHDVTDKIRLFSRKWLLPEELKVLDSFKCDSDLALKIILREWNDPAEIGRKLKMFVEDYLQEIE